MISLPDFRAQLGKIDATELVDNVLLADEALHVPQVDREHIREDLARTYKVSINDIYLRIVGSAKLGFSVCEKKDRHGHVIGARYRAFSAESDIDTAIVSPRIYEIIWLELTRYAHGQPYVPWDSRKLGDYMVYGWLRPDYFPTDGQLRQCDDWWNLFRKYSSGPRFNRRKVRGALFYSLEQLKRYQARAISDCIDAEKINLA